MSGAAHTMALRCPGRGQLPHAALETSHLQACGSWPHNDIPPLDRSSRQHDAVQAYERSCTLHKCDIVQRDIVRGDSESASVGWLRTLSW